MSDNEYLSEEEDDEPADDEEEDEEEEEENERQTNNKASKALTPLTFGKTFTNQHRIRTTHGVMEADEEDDDDREEDEEDEEDAIAEEDDDEDDTDNVEEGEPEDPGKSTSTTSKAGGGKGKRKRSKKGQASDTDSEDDARNTSPDSDEMEEDDEEDDGDEEDDADEEGEAEKYMHQFEKDLTKEYILQTHPECIPVNLEEVRAMLPVMRNEDGIIVDDFHRTLPIVTKYEKARIIGQRAMQLNSGATPYLLVDNLIDGTTIAELEFEQKKIPVIIKRPLPNGAFEYWRLQDLELLY
jgi:DNA-directed RNA polymerase subunit K/omega